MKIEARYSLKNARFEGSKLRGPIYLARRLGVQDHDGDQKTSPWIHGGVCLRVICLHILENHGHKYEKGVDSEGTELGV
jgi:hypothetical protein